MKRIVTATLALTSIAVAVMLVGCTALETDAVPSTAVATATPDAGETGASADADGWVYTSRHDDGSCADPRSVSSDESSNADSERRVGDALIPRYVDGGPTEYAEGEATLDADGYAVAYVVVDGDTVDGIADRFCASQPDLALLNHVRRTTAYSSGSDGSADVSDGGRWISVYAGDTLNLDPASITTVGDENGVVYDYSPDIHLPPQR